MFFPGCLFSPVVQAQLSSVIADRLNNSHLGYPGLGVSYGWRGRIGRSCWLKGPRGLLVPFAILSDRQHVCPATWPCDIPHCLSSKFSGIPAFLVCTVHSYILPPGLYSGSMFLGKPTLVFSFPKIPSLPLPSTLLYWASGTLGRQVRMHGIIFCVGSWLSAWK